MEKRNLETDYIYNSDESFLSEFDFMSEDELQSYFDDLERQFCGF